MIKIDGQEVKIGDWVCFKSDIEQVGKLIKTKTDFLGRKCLVLENKNGFDGSYIGGSTTTEVLPEDCWVE